MKFSAGVALSTLAGMWAARHVGSLGLVAVIWLGVTISAWLTVDRSR